MDLKELKARIEANKSKQPVSESSSFFSEFKMYYNVHTGNDRVPNYILRYLFKRFKPKSSETMVLSEREFFQALSRDFESGRWGKYRFYLLDKSELRFNEQNEFEVELERRTKKKQQEHKHI